MRRSVPRHCSATGRYRARPGKPYVTASVSASFPLSSVLLHPHVQMIDKIIGFHVLRGRRGGLIGRCRGSWKDKTSPGVSVSASFPSPPTFFPRSDFCVGEHHRLSYGGDLAAPRAHQPVDSQAGKDPDRRFRVVPGRPSLRRLRGELADDAAGGGARRTVCQQEAKGGLCVYQPGLAAGSQRVDRGGAYPRGCVTRPASPPRCSCSH